MNRVFKDLYRSLVIYRGEVNRDKYGCYVKIAMPLYTDEICIIKSSVKFLNKYYQGINDE